MRDDDPALLDRLEADLAAVEHAIGRLEQISSEGGDVVGAGDLAGRIRSVVEVPPFLDAEGDQSAGPDQGVGEAVERSGQVVDGPDLQGGGPVVE